MTDLKMIDNSNRTFEFIGMLQTLCFLCKDNHVLQSFFILHQQLSRTVKITGMFYPLLPANIAQSTTKYACNMYSQ